MALILGSPEKLIDSAPFHNDSTVPEARSSVEIAISPATPSVRRICFDDGIQRNQLGEDLRLGVRSRAAPPVAETEKMSPPVTPSSLINPPMNAIVLPSGDHLRLATCVSGLRIVRTAPDPASIEYSCAPNQLSSPDPGAARYARLFESGDQSNSYTYISAGEMTRAARAARFTIASRCS